MATEIKLPQLGENLSGGDVLDVFVGQRRRLRVHGRMRPLAAAILLQRRHDIRGMLVAQLGNAVVRIGVPVVVDAVAAVAGVELLLAECRIARCMRAGSTDGSCRNTQPCTSKRAPPSGIAPRNVGYSG